MIYNFVNNIDVCDNDENIAIMNHNTTYLSACIYGYRTTIIQFLTHECDAKHVNCKQP